MKLWISKKEGTKIKIHIEDEIDYEEIQFPIRSDTYTFLYAIRDNITDRLIDRAIDRWIDDNGGELFDKFDTDIALNEIKKHLLLKMFGDKNA